MPLEMPSIKCYSDIPPTGKMPASHTALTIAQSTHYQMNFYLFACTVITVMHLGKGVSNNRVNRAVS
jgi:hypothetical protein